jgi:hypothetical protein
MQTPYIITRVDTADTHVMDVNAPGRVRVTKDCGPFRFYFFPPDDPKMQADLEARLHISGDSLWFEDGFMLRYPEPYQPDVSQKLDQFDLPSIALDGAFSRIIVADGTLKIDGSATYLQMLCSCTENGQFYFSNNQTLLEEILQIAGQELTLSDRFLASHLIQAPLAFYIFAGTQWNEISYHDSLDTIIYDSDLRIEIHNKLSDPEVEKMPRDQRIDLLHGRLQHLIDQFCKWTDTEKFTHHLTAGRDSRMSFSLFKENQKDRLRLETGGDPHTTDIVIAKYIAEKYGIDHHVPKSGAIVGGFSYSNLLQTQHPYRYQVALFRKQNYRTKFDKNTAVANGYLGNSTVYAGTKKRQILPQEQTALTPDAYAQIEEEYDKIIADHEVVYGSEQVHRVFHLRYHTANKISATLWRLRQFCFCAYESDLLFMTYMLENIAEMNKNSIHYEMIRRSDEDLLTTIPFEPGKSFPEFNHTSEVKEFKGIKRVGGHRKFIHVNFDAICAHLETHGDKLPFFRKEYLAEIAHINRNDIPTLVINKLFALLGALEMKGAPLESYEEIAGTANDLANIYTPDFFQQMYLDGAVHASGLPHMLYGKKCVYRSFASIPDGHKLLVSVISTPVEKGQKVEVTKQSDGYTIHFEVDHNARYRVVHFSYDTALKKRTEIFRTTFVAQTVPPVQD